MESRKSPHPGIFVLPSPGWFHSGFLSILLQNLKRSRTIKRFGWNCSNINFDISSMLRLLTSFGGVCWLARFVRSSKVTGVWLVKKTWEIFSSGTEFSRINVLKSAQ